VGICSGANLTIAAIERIEAGEWLTRAEAAGLMDELLSGQLDTAEIVRLLLALNRRAIRAEELIGFAAAMRARATPVFAEGAERPQNMVDTCGTGGDGAKTFNVSTAAAIVAAAAGARVAKHGNRAASSRSGSADVLEALGVRIDRPFAECARAIREIGIAFFFAPAAHAATRHAAPARTHIGVRTAFNLLGPLTNPAGAQAQVLGVPSPEVIDVMAATLCELGVARAFVVHGAGGMDEISLAGETLVAEVRDGKVSRYVVTPETFGAHPAPLEAIAGGTAWHNAEIIRQVLAGEIGAPQDVVLVNAAAALVAADVARDFRGGMLLAREAIRSGSAQEKLAELVRFTNS
jgi:anthranilate phosphoribosyltransferase